MKCNICSTLMLSILPAASSLYLPAPNPSNIAANISILDDTSSHPKCGGNAGGAMTVHCTMAILSLPSTVSLGNVRSVARKYKSCLVNVNVQRPEPTVSWMEVVFAADLLSTACNVGGGYTGGTTNIRTILISMSNSKRPYPQDRGWSNSRELFTAYSPALSYLLQEYYLLIGSRRTWAEEFNRAITHIHGTLYV